MIERPKYLQQLINSKENGFPKVITGIRRWKVIYAERDISQVFIISRCIRRKYYLFRTR